MRKSYLPSVLIALITATAVTAYAEERTNRITLEEMHKQMEIVASAREYSYTSAHSEYASTFQASIQESVSPDAHRPGLERSQESRTFHATMEKSLARVGERNALNGLYLPAARLHWMSESFRGYGVHKDFASSGRDLFVSTFKNGTRDTLADTLPADALANWAGNLFRWSLRSDHLGPTYDRAAPSASDLGWWDSNTYEYGIDPWSLDAFARVSFGNNGRNSLTGGKPIAVIGADYRYDPLNQGRLRLHIVVPLPYSWEINAGCTVDGKNIATMDPSSFTYAARIQRVVGSGTRFRSLFYMGMQSNEGFLPKEDRGSEPAFAAGFTRPW